MSQHVDVVAAPESDDADSRVDMWCALIVLVTLVTGFLLLAGSFDGAI